MIGTTVGSYRITQKVSVGGMGTVYRAEHTLIGKQAAVKLLHPELCNNRDIVNRFFNEAKATTQIKHPGIVEVFDFGYLPSGHAYLVMEFLEGSSLAQRLELGDKMSEGEAAMTLRAVCNALGAAHAKKIVHRDLKPDNIFLVPDPETATGIRPKILDFGIAKLTDIGPAGTATKTGSVMGTPTYMSPEQCRGTGEIDHRSDLYSLGCILYEIVCGQAPFVSDGAGELIGQHLFVEPEPPTKHNPSVSPEAEQLIMALLKKDPKQRPQTARELGQALDKLAQRAGWITRTSPTGITAQSLPDVGVPTPEPKVPSGTSLGVTPVAREPSRPIAAARPPTPTPPPAVPEPELPRKTMSPTTLSGAASSIIDVPRRRRGMVIGAVGLAGVAAAIVFFVMTSGGGKDTAAPKAASEPTPATVPIAPSPPPPLPPPAPVEPPAAPPVPAPTPPAPTPPAPTPPPAHPTVVRPVRPRVVKPDVKPVKPDVKPTKPTSGTGSGSAKILIETDL